jgi:23S rRNA-/tRNA-specific pseudouridylate synthase
MKTPTPIEILFENEDLVAINKPAGIMVHSDGKSPEYTIGCLRHIPRVEM